MRVVIVGGGFGGVKAALELSKRQIGKITLISNETHLLHHATMYATATGRSFSESVIPLELIFAGHPNVEVMQDHITALDPQRRLISGDNGDYYYDKLILSLGSITNYSSIKGLKAHAFGIKTLDDIQEFQEHIHEDVVERNLDKEFFVIGAGQTGVELSGALQGYLEDLKELYRLKNTASKVVLVEARSRILPRLSKTASKLVEARLRKQGVKLLKNREVDALTGTAITIDDKTYETTTALWTSGLVNNPFYAEHAEYFHLTPDGYVIVSPYLEAFDDVYVIGENNSLKHSQVTLSSIQQAKHVAKNITRTVTKRPQAAFRPHTLPVGVPVNDTWAYVEWYGLYVAGRAGAFFRRLIDLYAYKQILPTATALSLWRAHDIRRVGNDFN